MSVITLSGGPGRDAVFDYQQLVGWADGEIKAGRLSPLVRVCFAGDKSFDYCFFDESFFCLFLRDTPLDGVRFQAQGYLIFRLILSGGMTQELGPDTRNMSGVSGSILSPSEATLGWTAHSSANQGVTGIVIFCRPQVLAARLNHLRDASGSSILDLHAQPDVSYSKTTIPCTQDMIRFGKELINSDLESDIALLHCEGLALLVMAEFLQSAARYRGRAGSTVQISVRDLQRLNDARAWVVSHYAEDLTISKLGRQVGLNKNKLTEGFRELFGTTVQGLLVDQRMQAALELVREGLPLEEIAERVGYGSSASLVRAFKRHYGSPPGKFARTDA